MDIVFFLFCRGHEFNRQKLSRGVRFERGPSFSVDAGVFLFFALRIMSAARWKPAMRHRLHCNEATCALTPYFCFSSWALGAELVCVRWHERISPCGCVRRWLEAAGQSQTMPRLFCEFFCLCSVLIVPLFVSLPPFNSCCPS